MGFMFLAFEIGAFDIVWNSSFACLRRSGYAQAGASDFFDNSIVTAQVDRLKVDRLKEKTCAITQSQDRLDTLTGDCVMDDHYYPSVFSLNT